MSAAKEHFRLRRNIDRLTDGQASLGEVDWENGRLDKFKVVINPNAGYYKGGKFVFEICLQEEYPSYTPPNVYCETNVWHPNITPANTVNDGDDDDECDEDETAREPNVCLNLLDDGIWNPAFGLESLVLGLLFLMHNPNFDDPLNSEFECVKWSERSECLARYMKGEEVYGHVYKMDLDDKVKSLTDKTATELPTASQTVQKELHTDENCPPPKLGTNEIEDTGKDCFKIDTDMDVEVGTECSNLATDANIEISKECSIQIKTGNDFDIELASNENSEPKTYEKADSNNDCFTCDANAKGVGCGEGLRAETDANVTIDTHSSRDAASAEFIATVEKQEADSYIGPDIEGSKLQNVSGSDDSKERLKPEQDTNVCYCNGSTHETDGIVDALNHQSDSNVDVDLDADDSKLPPDTTDDNKGSSDINTERVQAPSRHLVTGSTTNDIKTFYESCVDEEDDITINTMRLIAFDGGFVLYGGTDSELQDLTMSETITTDAYKSERTTCPPNNIVS